MKQKISAKKVFFVSLAAVCFFSYTFIVPHQLMKRRPPLSYALYDRSGILLGASVASDGQWRFEEKPVNERFQKAIIEYEDRRFFYHPGIDPMAIARAIVQNLGSRRIVSGGSTLTMQVVRILDGSKKRTLIQKIKEAFIAGAFELRFSKKRILEIYAANAPFGSNVVGLEAAGWRYFNRAPEELTWAEAATLAVLPNQPSLVYPGSNREMLLKKRNRLLNILYERKYFDKEVLELSLMEELPEKPFPLPQNAYHYLEYLKKKNGSSSRFLSDIDFSLQKNLDRIVNVMSEKFSYKGINNAAAIIIETKTGKVIAYTGNTGLNGRNEDSWAIDMIQAERSSGSLLKPFLFAAELDSGMILPEQLVLDVPTRIGSYKPENNVKGYYGAIEASDALCRSLNIPAVRGLQKYGIAAFLDYLKKCGFSTLLRDSGYYGLPLILGGGEITLYEAVYAYAGLMNRAAGENSEMPCSPGAAWLTINALSNGNRPSDEALWKSYANSKKIAWKTGTSNGFKDCWSIGTTADYTVGVWVGNADGRGNEQLTSSTTSSPLMFDIFSILPQSSWPEIPYADLEAVETCGKSGYLASSDCADSKENYRPSNAPKPGICPYCHTYFFTPDGRNQAVVNDMTGIYAGQVPLLKKCFVLPPSVEYWYKKHRLGYKTLPPFVSWHKSTGADGLEIVFPNKGAEILIPIEIDGSSGALVMEAAVNDINNTVYWDLNGEY